MKWGLPLAFTVTQLAWNVIEFGDAMKSVNEFEEAMDAVKWGADYLINAHPSPNVFYGQFGDSEIDFKYFGPPEEYEMWALGPKPVYAVSEFLSRLLPSTS
jgi:endoglucanase